MATQGTMKMYASKACSKSVVKSGEIANFKGGSGSFTGSLHPKFEGTGSDNNGNYKITSLGSNINGDKIQLSGIKQYSSGKNKNKR